ncbi:hypothetical protein GGR51DRAFT_503130 [Nemania sp. FL0031]|nr:hypothetical protein GGR51DRAFT_503130 [Nemania sp. FL0031]
MDEISRLRKLLEEEQRREEAESRVLSERRRREEAEALTKGAQPQVLQQYLQACHSLGRSIQVVTDPHRPHKEKRPY